MTVPGPFAATSLQGEWTIDALHQFFIRLLAEMDMRYEQRYAAQNEAVRAAMTAADAALERVRVHTTELVAAAEQRATARSEGLEQALSAAIEDCRNRIVELDKLTEAKFVTYRTLIDSSADKVALALTAADKAVNKAELATEKRFEGVNEFRSQLSDQAATFMPRTEAEARTAQNTEKISDMNTRIAELDKRIAEISSRTGGHQDSTKNLVTIIGLALGALTIVVSIYLAMHK